MRLITARISPTTDEEGTRQAYAAIEMAEYEIRDLRLDKIKQIEGGVCFHRAKMLIEDIAVMDRAIYMIRVEKEARP